MGRLPSLKPREVIQKLQRGGFIFHHQRGSHAYYQYGGDPLRWVAVPMHPGTIRKGTLASIIKQSGLSRDTFLSL